MRANLLGHPLRGRIIMALSGGHHMTTQQIARVLPEDSRTSMYRHIQLLVEGGILKVVATHQVRGITEKVYALNEAAAELLSSEHATLSASEHRQYFSTFVSELLAACQRYLDNSDATSLSGLHYWMRGIYLSSEEFDACLLAIRTIIEQAQASGPGTGRQRYFFFQGTIPTIDDPSPHGEGSDHP